MMARSTRIGAMTHAVSRMRLPIRPITGPYSMARAVTKAADSQVVRHSMRPSSLLAEAMANGIHAMRSYQLNEFGVVTSHDAYSTTACLLYTSPSPRDGLL